jgi:flagellar biosynthetic protein FlhB
MPDFDADKSQEATPHRRQQAREQGQAAKSHDLASALVLLAALGALMWLGGAMIDALAHYTHERLAGPPWLSIEMATLMAEVGYLGALAGRWVLPILGLAMLAGVLGHVGQTGFFFLPEKVALNWSHLNPIRGLERILSLEGVVRLGFGMFKVAVVTTVAAVSVWNRRELILGLSALEVGEIARHVVELVVWTALKMAAALVVLALLDYLFQRWRFEQQLRMTPQEVREEMKNLQGDPHILARRRQIQRQLVLNRLKTGVPKADVVVTNPTHLAVAIQYLPDQMQAPIVVAKGAGVLAQRIRRLALEHDIPIVENKPLARLLYQEVDVNRPIPDKAYAAVAEVLAYVYQLKGKSLPPRAA